MNSSDPLVSVLMTAYNREMFIGQAIESVLSSTYKNFELIIVDDGSTDRTVEIARRYQVTDERIKLYVNEQNLGDYLNRNKAAGYASGKYLKYLDSDDVIYPWGLNAMVYCMEKFPEAGFGLMSYGIAQSEPYPILVQPLQAFRFFYFKFALVSMGPTGAIFTKTAFEAVNGFSGKPYVGDSEIWIKIGSKYPLVRMPFDLVWWREHEGQQINEGRNNDYYLQHQYRVYVDGLQNLHCPLPINERNMALRNLKNVRVRKIMLDYFLKLNIKKGMELLRTDGLTLPDIFKAMRKNLYKTD